MRSPPFPVGALCGAYVVLGPPSAGKTAREVCYAVQCRACGEPYVRSHERLVANIREDIPHCPDCAKQRPMLSMGVGERFGYCTIIDLPWQDGRPAVRHECCGTVAYMTMNRLWVLRHDERLGLLHTCRPCFLKAHNQPGQRRRKAPPARPLAGDAVLTDGLVSAALAWPRPASLRT